jgi:hypothetical protein
LGAKTITFGMRRRAADMKWETKAVCPCQGVHSQIRHVGFARQSGHLRVTTACLFWANSGSRNDNQSITASATASTEFGLAVLPGSSFDNPHDQAQSKRPGQALPVTSVFAR